MLLSISSISCRLLPVLSSRYLPLDIACSKEELKSLYVILVAFKCVDSSSEYEKIQRTPIWEGQFGVWLEVEAGDPGKLEVIHLGVGNSQASHDERIGNLKLSHFLTNQARAEDVHAPFTFNNGIGQAQLNGWELA